MEMESPIHEIPDEVDMPSEPKQHVVGIDTPTKSKQHVVKVDTPSETKQYVVEAAVVPETDDGKHVSEEGTVEYGTDSEIEDVLPQSTITYVGKRGDKLRGIGNAEVVMEYVASSEEENSSNMAVQDSSNEGIESLDMDNGAGAGMEQQETKKSVGSSEMDREVARVLAVESLSDQFIVVPIGKDMQITTSQDTLNLIPSDEVQFYLHNLHSTLTHCG